MEDESYGDDLEDSPTKSQAGRRAIKVDPDVIGRQALGRPTAPVLRRAIETVEEEYADDHAYGEAVGDALTTAAGAFAPLTHEERAHLAALQEWVQRARGRPDAKAGELLRFLDATVGPVGRCNGHNQFHDLFLVEVFTECVEVDIIDVARVAGQQVGEAQDSPLDWVEEFGVPPAAGLTQSGDLVVVVPSPPRRGGVRAGSILAAVEDRRAEVCQVLELLWQLRVGRPERATEQVVRAQDGRLVSQHPDEWRHHRPAGRHCVEDALDVGTCRVGGDRPDSQSWCEYVSRDDTRQWHSDRGCVRRPQATRSATERCSNHLAELGRLPVALGRI